MPRRSQGLDATLLASGRALLPRAGCAGLSVRAVAEHAGANPAMFHYHFGSKDDFLRTLLQQAYEQMFASLAVEVAVQDTALERLRAGLLAMARFARAHRPLLARVWMDAVAGVPVAVEFFRRNAPRHLGLLAGLLRQAENEGALRTLPPLQANMFVLGAVLLPGIFVAGLADSAALPAVKPRPFAAQVMSDAAIAERIDLALQALAAVPAARGARRARRTPGMQGAQGAQGTTARRRRAGVSR